jgi:hypothetical protein
LRTIFLEVNSRLLIGGVFVAAVLWKLLSGDFLNGSFMTFTLLLDSRFAGFADWATGVGQEALAQNGLQLRRVMMGHIEAAELASAPGISIAAMLLTWYTVLIEGAVAVAFLAPKSSWLWRRRNAMMVIFVATVYSIATVIGFAWTLVILGYAQCKSDERGARLSYLVVFLCCQFYLLPWRLFLS